jgi:hypothetical protein
MGNELLLVWADIHLVRFGIDYYYLRAMQILLFLWLEAVTIVLLLVGLSVEALILMVVLSVVYYWFTKPKITKY